MKKNNYSGYLGNNKNKNKNKPRATRRTTRRKTTKTAAAKPPANRGRNNNNGGNNGLNNNNNSRAGRTTANHFALNKYLAPIVKDIKLEEPRKIDQSRVKIHTEAEYQQSFADILQFEKRVPASRKKNFDVCLYHTNNTDGFAGAYVFWNFMTDGGTIPNVDITIKGIQSGSPPGRVSDKVQRVERLIAGKRVLIIDLGMNNETVDYIRDITEDFLIIDDHPNITTSAAKYPDNVFSNKMHSASASTYKFFYPDQKIPLLFQYIDSNDIKMFLPYLVYTNAFDVGLSVRITKNNFLKRKGKMDMVYGGAFSLFHEIFQFDNPNMIIFMGKYMTEIRENMKYEAANNVTVTKLLGYNVGILNFELPGLSKVVARQILSDFKERGQPLDFAITWSYQQNSKKYRFQIVEDHSNQNPVAASLANYIAKSGICPNAIDGGGRDWMGNLIMRGDGNQMPPPLEWMMNFKLSPADYQRFKPGR
jgi:hypothetical protein